ncbi:MAG: glycosyltransferase family 2 protein [Chloroflexi bacterium]|nr:MAG: glycosyltransferase family 2 protein [Chloroflexota bacterium]
MVDASIIIPTYNRRKSLLETLTAIDHQVVGDASFEVLVVDDGSTDGTEAIYDKKFSFPLNYLQQANQGSAVARNTGAAKARGWLLIFLDDDMDVERQYVSKLIQLHRRHPHAVGMGAFLPWCPPHSTPFNRIYARLNATQDLQTDEAVYPYTECVTNNLSVEREDFFRIGQMQDIGGDGPTWWGDVDFGYRASQAGMQFRRSNRAACYHHDYAIRDLATAITRAEKAARMAVLLFKKYPAILPDLPMFTDKTPIRWGSDSPWQILRKGLRRAASARLVLQGLQVLAGWLEQNWPAETILAVLYRWILGGYLYWGMRQGFQQFGNTTVPSVQAGVGEP